MPKFTRSNRKISGNVDWTLANDIKVKTKKLLKELDLDWIDANRLFFFRSKNSSSRAYARIWGLSKIWQQALSQKPAYIIEVLSERFDKLKDIDKDKVLLHELTHIPKNFSGSLLPHVRKRGKRNFKYKLDILIDKYTKNKR